jgi:putative transposase
MAKPLRPTDPQKAIGCPRKFFVTTQTAGRRPLFQTERMASLLIDVLRSQMRARRMTIHDFVVMPDHVHILLTLPGDLKVEKAMQLIKGGFSFRVGRELGFPGEVWQRGFTDVVVADELSQARHRASIDQNPVRAGLASSGEEYPFGSAFLKNQKRARTKAPILSI